MRKTAARRFFLELSGFCFVFCLIIGCTNEHGEEAKTGNRSLSATPTSVHLQRGIPGLELGMTPEQVGQSFKIDKDRNLLKDLLKSCLKPEVFSREKAIQKNCFRVSQGRLNLPEGAMWAEMETAHNRVNQIVLHYDEPSVERMGWDGIVSPYVAKYGEPTKNGGSAVNWRENDTRIDIKSSGSTITVYFTDKTLEAEVKRAERNGA